MILLFTGSDWDGDSQVFVKEVLYEDSFYHVLKKDFVFVHLDFPEMEKNNVKVIENKSQLKERFKVDTFPTLVMLDRNQNEISRIGLFAHDAEKLASHLKSLFCRYDTIEKGLEMQVVDSTRLKEYYMDAKELGAATILQKILTRGLKVDTDPYFHLEKYTAMLTSGDADPKELETVRQKILSIDPDNQFDAQYRLAILDFQSYAENAAKSPNDAVEPLLTFVNKFGKSDPTHVWRVHMMVSQYLYSKGELENALEHARTSYKEAPSFMKRDAYQNVEYLKKEVGAKI